MISGLDSCHIFSIPMSTIFVPTINDSTYDFEVLFDLWDQMNGVGLQIDLDFSKCKFLRQNAVAFIGGLIRLTTHSKGNVVVKWETLSPALFKHLQENGFVMHFEGGRKGWVGNSIPYREDREQVKNDLVDYLKRKWLGRDWVHVSEGLTDAIVGRVWEIFANAFEHSGSRIGIFTCGQHFPRRRELNLTVVDFGVGIPSNVRSYRNDQKIAAGNTMKWAFQRGTSTKPADVGRGIGLDLLKEFVKITGGSLRMFSHEGYAYIDSIQEKFVEAERYFGGTLVNISLKCDDSLYRLTTEAVEGPVF